jgi:hypothetical protein
MPYSPVSPLLMANVFSLFLKLEVFRSQISTSLSLFSMLDISLTINPKLASSLASLLLGSMSSFTSATIVHASSRTTHTWLPVPLTALVLVFYLFCPLLSLVLGALLSHSLRGGVITLMATTTFALWLSKRKLL